MDASRLSRWTRFAKKGGIGKCVALQHRVAEHPDDLMFFQDDEITVLRQLPEEDGFYLGYCEGVVGRFAAAHVQFTGKLKTPVITRRSSSSKSPRPRSLTPSRKQQPSQSPPPSLSRTSSGAEDLSSLSHAHSGSSAPSVPNPSHLGHAHSFSETSFRPDATAEPSHQDLLVTPSASYSSSSSSARESASPLTPSEFFGEPHLRDKTRPSAVSDASRAVENGHSSTTHSLRQKQGTLEAPLESKPGFAQPTEAPDILGTERSRSHSSDTFAPTPLLGPRPPSPSRIESSSPHLDVDDKSSVHVSRLSAALSDGAAGIGLSMLQDFLSGKFDDEDDKDEDGDDSDHESSFQSDPDHTSLDETVEGFPAPPTQIPTPSSRATSMVLDALRPVSSNSEYSEDGDGASLYDNYRYSRLSISSKMSKSSGYTAAAVPPPIPTELPPPVRRSQDSQYSAPTPAAESLSPTSETSPVPLPPREATPPTAIQSTRNIPPPLALESRSDPSNPATVLVSSPLLHTNFGSPQSSPPDANTATMLSPISAAFDLRGSGVASALRQKIESDRGISSPSPLLSPSLSMKSDERASERSQSIVVEDGEGNAPGVRGALPRSPSSPAASFSSTTSEKKRRGGPPPLVVMNPAPPPPYTPRSPQASGSSPTFAALPTPTITHPPPQPVAEPAANTSLFLPHPNAPKSNSSPQGPLYGRAMPPVQPFASPLLVQTMHKAAQMRIGPNGLPCFSTFYASMTQDLSVAVGPVPILFSIEPLKDIPATRMRVPSAPAPAPVPASTQSILPPKAGAVQHPPTPRQAATSNVIPRPSFVPKAGAVRPRSRSFSGFDSPLGAETPPKEQSKGEARARRPSTADSPPSSFPNPMAARAAASNARIHQARQYTPSPLSLSQRTTKSSLDAGISSSPSHPSSSPTSPTVRRTLTPVKSEPSLRAGPPRSTQEREASPRSSAKPDLTGSSRVPHSLSNAAPKGAAPSIQISVSDSQLLSSRTATGNDALFSRQLSAGSLGRKLSVEVEGPGHGDSRTSASAPSAPLGRSGSLRSKISLSALRAKSQRDDDGLLEGDTVQVKDTDFELVRPNVSRQRASDDSFAKSPVNERRPSFLRVDSPSTSSTSGGASDTRSPVSPSAMSLHPIVAGVSAVEAHRARELKWISAMSSTPSSHARKSKKIRKLLQEGVPASVRYQVWAHLTDSRAKRIEGLYAQLGEREKVLAFADIQRDAQLYFSGDARLSQPNGPLVSLLQAYLTMVPDVQYSKGLAFIAGQLLLQSPEEDAFWIFISLMDSHLRSYFSSNAVQLDIDASLFAKAVETINPTIAKKLFVDMGIAPVRICRPWFSSLFVETLPTDYFQRVWDIFLSDGMVFLLRIGLAIVMYCRRTLLEVHQEAEALNMLVRPPSFLIASSPDSLIELANSFRLKDDDIRKQRVRLEAQVKLQTQSRLSNVARRSSSNVNNGGASPASIISLPIS